MNTIWEHVLCITMILSILPIMAVAEGNGVPYLDETGTLAETGVFRLQKLIVKM